LVASSFFIQLGHIAGPRSGILTLHLVHFFMTDLPSSRHFHKLYPSAQGVLWTYSHTLLFRPSLLNLSEFFKGTGNFMTPQGSQEGK